MPRTFNHELEEIRQEISGPLVCAHCGAENSIRADYSETAYGTADVVSRDGELEDYDIGDYDNFQISMYRCIACDSEEENLNNLILEEGEVFHREEEPDDREDH